MPPPRVGVEPGGGAGGEEPVDGFDSRELRDGVRVGHQRCGRAGRHRHRDRDRQLLGHEHFRSDGGRCRPDDGGVAVADRLHGHLLAVERGDELRIAALGADSNGEPVSHDAPLAFNVAAGSRMRNPPSVA